MTLSNLSKGSMYKSMLFKPDVFHKKRMIWAEKCMSRTLRMWGGGRIMDGGGGTQPHDIHIMLESYKV
jgi:hypothetical protein